MRWWRHCRAAGRQRGDRPDSRAAKTGRSHSQTRSMSIWGALLCLGLSTTVGLAQNKAEVPKGYEDAAPAGQRRPAARAAPAARDRPTDEMLNRTVLEVLTDAVEKRADANVRKLKVQDLPQLRQFVKPELAFVRRVCEPDKEQFREVGAAVQERFGIAVGEQAVRQNQIQFLGARAGAMGMPQLRTVFQEQMTTIVRAKLRPEQVERYEEECAHRTARRKRAVVLNLVAKLDDKLSLSSDQREKLVESLTAGYQETWGQWLVMLTHIAQFTPDIPQDCVLPALSEKQKAVWRETPKMGTNVMGGLHFAPAMVVIEDAELEEL